MSDNILEPTINGLPPVTDWQKVFLALQQANEAFLRGATLPELGKQIVGDVQIQGADFVDLPVAEDATPVPLPIPETGNKFGFLADGKFTQPAGGTLEYSSTQWGLTLFDGTKWVKKFTLELPQVDTTNLVKTEQVKAIIGKNKFNKATIVSGHYLNKDNLEFPSSTYCYSDFIPVKPSTVYSGKSAIGGIADGIRYATFFGANKQPLNLGTNEHVYQIATTAATAFMKITITESGKDTFLLEEGSNFTAYEPYVENLKSVAGVPVKDSYSKSEVDGITADLVTDSQLEQSLQSVYNSMSSLPNSGTSAAVLLANNKVSEIDGKVTELTITAGSSGNAMFQVIERKTFNYPTPEANNREFFLGKQIFQLPVTAGKKTYLVPTNVDIRKGDTVAWVGKTGYVPPLFNNSVTTGWWQGAAGEISGQVQLTYQTGTIALSFKVVGDKFATKAEIEKKVVINKVTATRNANDYNSIRDIMKSIMDASDYNRTEIVVPKGSWFEIDIKGKKNVKIKGIDRDFCILTADTTLTDAKYVSPSDFSYPENKDKQLNSITKEQLNIFYPKDDLDVEGVTISLKRGKYPVHLDNIEYVNAKFTNCRIKDLGDCNYPIGVGEFGAQKIQFIGCIIERPPLSGRQLGVFYHNWNNQNSSCDIEFINCHFINCGYALLDELGSGQVDNVKFINCTTDSIGEIRVMVGINSSNTSYYTDPATGLKEADPTKVPYSIHLNTSGTNVDLVTINNAFPAPYAGMLERPDIYKHIISDYVCQAKLAIDGQILAGDLICNSLDNMSNQISCQKHTGDLPILGVALESANLTGSVIRYVPKGKITALNVEGAVLSGVNKKLIFDKTDGKVKPSSAADLKDIIGYSIESKGAGRPDSLSRIL